MNGSPAGVILLYGLVGQAVRAAEADRGRAALLAAVSHDLRTPLAAAMAAISSLRSDDVPIAADDQEELLAIAEQSLGQLARLADSLLDVSRLQAGAPGVFPRPADVGDIIASSLDGLGPRGRAVLTRIPPELPEVMADPAITERVIANLVSNALRHSPPGSPPLLTARPRGDRVELRVVDHGPGIPETDRTRVFLPFCRLGEQDRRTGVGLGLVVSRGLAEAMGGTVQPEETPGGGVTMVVSLPAAPAMPAEIGGACRIRAALHVSRWSRKQRLMQLRTARDAELPEHLAQVVIHGAGADEELGGDRMVRGALGSQPGDARLLRRERVWRPGSASSGVLAGGAQLSLGAAGECRHAQRAEQLAGSAQLLTRATAAALAAQPLAVQEMGPGQFGGDLAPPQVLD